MIFYLILLDLILLVIALKYIMDTYVYLIVLKKDGSVTKMKSNKAENYQFIKYLY